MLRRRLITALLGLAVPPTAALAGEGGPAKKQPPYLPLKSLTLTIVRPNRRHGAMTVDIGLNIPDAKLRFLAEQSQPILRDAYVAALQPYAIRMDPGSAPDMEFLTLALQRETDRVLGRRGARVLLGGVIII